MSLAIASILKEEVIEDFESYVENQKKYLLMSLKYRKTRNPVICKLNE
jgi:ribosomal protein S8